MASGSTSDLGSLHDDITDVLEPSFAEKLTLPSSNPPAPLLDVPDISAHQFDLVIFGKLFASSYVSDKLIANQLHQQWQLPHELIPIPVGKGVFRFDLESENEKNFILSQGPWVVGGHYMSFQGRSPDTPIEKISFHDMELWIQIYDLPIERLNSENGFNLGKRIGKPLQVDDEHHYGDFGSFLRVKLQVDTRLPLPNGIEYLNQSNHIKFFPIRIEKLNYFCFYCGKLGHEKTKCGARSTIMSKESVMVKRRYSVALKGFPLESTLHDFQWFIRQQNHEQRETEEDRSEENADPMHRMQIDNPTSSQQKGPSDTSTPSKHISQASLPTSHSNSLDPTTLQCPSNHDPNTCTTLPTTPTTLISIPVSYANEIPKTGFPQPHISEQCSTPPPPSQDTVSNNYLQNLPTPFNYQHGSIPGHHQSDANNHLQIPTNYNKSSVLSASSQKEEIISPHNQHETRILSSKFAFGFFLRVD
ncbi:hypothetical protein FRX31_031070 [Thalictrum thalictroides]|uniref:CCHC-type domain-containing protein n=1 Tax=Thalictrum thalictroides TaxID=46969 RepID=A0A7J6V367_THATH|nr:hypothetical protein FRX31_031070 [Thalictrum thalictroides]